MDTIESLSKRIAANRNLLANNPSSYLLVEVIEEDEAHRHVLCMAEANAERAKLVDSIKDFATGHTSRREWANKRLKEYGVPEEEWLS